MLRQMAWREHRAEASRPARGGGDREGQRGADEKRERRLDQVVQRAALPRHVVVLKATMAQKLLAGKASWSVHSRIASASMRNITNPRNASIDSTRAGALGCSTAIPTRFYSLRRNRSSAIRVGTAAAIIPVMTCKRLIITGLCSLLCAQAATAQPRWGHERMPSLPSGFNDRISSVRVFDGTVVIFKDSDFRGRSSQIRSDVRDLRGDWKDKVSSIRVY